MATASRAPRARMGPFGRVDLRLVRLATGLVLFAYVLTHLTNHALGNISIGAMERGLDWAAWLWLGPAMLPLLYGSLLVHLGLGLKALYERRPFRYRPSEAVQLGLGLLIPILLMNHIVGTRLAYALHGTAKGYPQELYSFFVAAPHFGVLQFVTLLVAWTHGCLGVYFWLRLKPFFPRFGPVLLCIAVLVPVLALLGVVQGGRAVMALVDDPAWRAVNLTPGHVGTPEGNAQLATIRNVLIAVYGVLVAFVVAARFARRGLEIRRGLICLTYPGGRTARVSSGTSVLEASRLNRIPHASICGGRGRCSTCRIRVIGHVGTLPTPSAAERAVLDRLGAEAGIRLACQLRPVADLVVAPLLSPDMGLADLHLTDARDFGEERFIVAMFVDMRGSTALAQTRLPYDTVFLINRFLEAVGSAVTAAGGQPNQFLGDGMMALFGVDSRAADAARSALKAISLIAAEIGALNDLLVADLPEPLRFGIGLHGGTAILGEIGDRRSGRVVFTAIGDPVNVAARLEVMSKRLGCEAVVSQAVFDAAGLSPDLPRQAVEIDGWNGSIEVRTLARAADTWRDHRDRDRPEDDRLATTAALPA